MANVIQTVLGGAPTPHVPHVPPVVPARIHNPSLDPNFVPPAAPPKAPMNMRSLLDGTKALWEDTKTGVTKHLSLHDELKAYDPKLADDLFTNSVDNIGDSADSYAHAAKIAGDERLRLFYDTLDNKSGMNTLKNILWPSSRKAGMAKRGMLEDETMKYLNTAYYYEQRGEALGPHPVKDVQDLVDAYRKSGYAKDMLARRQRAGEDVKGITASDNYVPQNWNYHKFARVTRHDPELMRGYARAFGEQIIENYPNLAKVGLTAEQVGKTFLKTQRDKITMDANAPFKGVNQEELIKILEGEVTDPAALATLKAQLLPKIDSSGKQANTKTRMSFDVSRMYQHSNGQTFQLADVLDTSMQRILESYNLSASARIGLARKGITSSDMLTERFSAILKPLEGTDDYAKTKAFLDNVRNDLLHRPTGEALSDWMRTGQVAANALFLKRSGLYNFIDYSRTVQRHGFANVVGKFLPAFKGVMSTTPMDVNAARTITDIVHSQLTNNGRMYSVISHLEDNFATPLTMGHEWAQVAGQTVRFINGSEILRRQHIKLISNLQADMLNDLAKGVQSSKDYLKSLNVPPAKMDEIAAEIKQHGLYTEKWNQDLSDYLTSVLIHDSDNMALMLKRGETPALMRYSTAGKILFPFFSFSAAANQKILRQSYRADGISGVGISMVHQASLATVVAAAANVMDGKEWDDGLAKRAVMIAPILGYTGYAFGMINQGQVGNTPNVFALPNAVGQLAGAISKGDVVGAMQQMPGVAVFPGVKLLESALKE